MIGRSALVRSHPRRMAAFTAIGFLNTAIDIAAFGCLYHFVGLDLILSNVLSFLIAVTNSYVMNRLITFADRRGRGTLASFARFVFVAGVSMTVSTAIVYLISMVTHPMIAKIVAAVASMTINYLGSCLFVFVGESEKTRHTSTALR